MENIQTFNGVIGTNGIEDKGGITSPFLNAATTEISGSAKINELIPYGLALTLNGEEYTVTGFTGTALSVDIPEFYNGKPITSIGAQAFANKGIVKISLSENIINIENGAFQNCTALKEVTLPSKLQQIGDNAFLGSGLTRITIEKTAVPITGTTAFPTGVAFYVPYTSLAAYRTVWGAYGSINANKFNGVSKNADLATHATYAQYASEDVSKGTIEKRLTDLGFKQGSVTLAAGVTATVNELKRQGNYVIGNLVLQTTVIYDGTVVSLNVGTIPQEFLPIFPAGINEVELNVRADVYIYSKTAIPESAFRVIPGLSGKVDNTGVITFATSAIINMNLYVRYSVIKITFGYEALPIK